MDNILEPQDNLPGAFGAKISQAVGERGCASSSSCLKLFSGSERKQSLRAAGCERSCARERSQLLEVGNTTVNPFSSSFHRQVVLRYF